MWKFETWLKNRLQEIAADLGLEGYNFNVYDERDFVKKILKPNNIEISVKYLTGNKISVSTVQPLQIIVLSGANDLQVTQLILSKFFNTYNWFSVRDGTTNYRMQYNSPAVLDNFQTVGYGVRAVIFLSATLFIMENVFDIEGDLEINGEVVPYISGVVSFGANVDSVQFPTQNLADSIVTTAAFNLSLVVPSQMNNFVYTILKVVFGQESNNKKFNFKFQLGIGDKKIQVGYDPNSPFTLRMIGTTYATAKNDVPGLQIGFSR